MKMIFSKSDKSAVLYDRCHVFENSLYPDHFDHLFAPYLVPGPDSGSADGPSPASYQEVEMPPGVEMSSGVDVSSKVEM